MKSKIIILLVVLLSACCPSEKPTKNQYAKYQIVSETPKWITYKVSEGHFMCIPNYNADKGAIPTILKVKDE